MNDIKVIGIHKCPLSLSIFYPEPTSVASSRQLRALLSPNDWQLGETFPASIVLTMYQVTGNKGWNGKKIWIPNIKLPEQVDYYDIEE